MKLVIDTNVLIEAWKDDFSYPRKIVDEVLAGNLEVYVDESIRREYELILNRLVNDDKHRKLIEHFIAAANIISPNRKIDVVKFDKEDNKFYNVALASGVSYIVTKDVHFFETGEIQGVRPIKPKDFWLEYSRQNDKSGQQEWQNWMRDITGN